MTNEEAIKELKAEKIAHINNGYSGTTEHFDLAIEALEMQTPKKPIIKAWGAASCPCCGVHLSESLGDGYYKHWTSLKFCDCGQKLVWD